MKQHLILLKHICPGIIMAALLLTVNFSFTACNDDNDDSSVTPVDSVTDTFAKGADVSWVTEMENSGYLFYDSTGIETECMQLLKSYGINAIRLRTWVNPDNGWCNKEDLLIKAWRAKQLGLRIMIDFHYSDTWADPANQEKPAAWKGLGLTELTRKLSDYTTDVMETLKANDITPDWVQVGNETTYGMLWDDEDSISGRLSANNGANFTQLYNAGYDAIKSIFPEARVIVHIDRGQRADLTENVLSTMKANGAKLDVVGLSLYPDTTSWQTDDESCLANMQQIVDKYRLQVMVCETGMPWDASATSRSFLDDLITKTRSLKDEGGNSMGLGIFYWEPECYNGWNSYTEGAFDNDGAPTQALKAFLDN